MTTPKLPPFESLLKSRDVEDPVNLWVHRPLAYGLVAAIYRTPVTPNQITLLAILTGVTAGACFVVGTRELMVWGGALLWLSAILDGADGILARAKNLFTPLGRAIDGTGDAIVAVATVLPAGYHLWITQHDPSLFVLLPVAIVSAVLHIELYDYYKESYMQMTNRQWSGKPERVADAEARLARAQRDRSSFVELIASHAYVGLVTGQAKLVARVDPAGSRDPFDFKVSDESVAIYRKHNQGPMKIWALISLAPHSYTMAILAMLDRLDLYLWLRLTLGNALFALVLLWQRRASRSTRAELAGHGLAPEPAAAA
jgi:phosphatidylglycerophosphate synthase